MKLLLVLLVLLLGCKRDVDTHTPFAEKLEQLVVKKNLYCELSKEKFLEVGYFGSKCDSMLFTALHAVGCDDKEITLDAFEGDPGKWYRSPEHDCFVPPDQDNGSKTTISRDMFRGALIYWLYTKDLGAIERTVAYGKANDWLMGEGINSTEVFTRTYVNPQMMAEFYDIRDVLESGEKLVQAPGEQNLDVIPLNDGFRAHLDVLAVLLAGLTHKAITSFELNLLEGQAERQKGNALYQAAYHLYTDGNQSDAVAILLDQDLFPDDELPTSYKNYCTDYLFQHDKKSGDWNPCLDEEIKIHDGTDLIFATAVLTNYGEAK